MGQILHKRIEGWKKRLLDLGKGNRLINFKEGKRTSVCLTGPDYASIYGDFVEKEYDIIFPHIRKNHETTLFNESINEEIDGNVEVSISVNELQKTLYSLRNKARSSIEEQGINVLYLAFGLLQWHEKDTDSQALESPIILVPVKLTIESLVSPYKLILHEDEIVVNPALSFKLANDFGIILPEFDSAEEAIGAYFDRLEKLVKENGWKIKRSVNLTLLSFLKINMYKDLERNEKLLENNPIILSIVRENPPIAVSPELNNIDHDSQEKPIDVYQVVDADSSQQDAITLSKKGVSFVLQGPPGTGKSQTITNIIAEALADGKKVLFVSEKMAALQVVYNRLAKVGLSDFCFTLHSHKANKKEILRDLSDSIHVNRTKLRDDALFELERLERNRKELNDYDRELHTLCSGLNLSIYTINGKIAKLASVPDVIFNIPEVDKVTLKQLDSIRLLLMDLSKTIGEKSEDYSVNVWRDSNIEFISHELTQNIDSNILKVTPLIEKLIELFEKISEFAGVNFNISINNAFEIARLFEYIGKCPIIPSQWVLCSNIDKLISSAQEYEELINLINSTYSKIAQDYNSLIFKRNFELDKRDFTIYVNYIKGLPGFQSKLFVLDEIQDLSRKVYTAKIGIEGIYADCCKLANLIGFKAPENLQEIGQFISLVKDLNESFSFTAPPKWFDPFEIKKILGSLSEIKTIHDHVLELKKSILKRCDKEILTLNYYPILQKFRGEYNTIFRVLKKQYRDDISILRGYISNGDRISYKEAVDILISLKDLAESEQEIKLKQETYEEFFGSLYNGVETNWDLLNSSISLFSKIIQSSYKHTALFGELYLKKELPCDEIEQFISQYAQWTSEKIYKEYEVMLSLFAVNVYAPLSKIRDATDVFITITTNFSKLYDSIQLCTKGSTNCEKVLADLNTLVIYQGYIDTLKEKHKVFDAYDEFQSYYDGIDTDWNRLKGALNYAKQLKQYVDLYSLPDKFVTNICESSTCICSSDDYSGKVNSLLQQIHEPLNWFISLFENGDIFMNMHLADLQDRLDLCRRKKYLLEEWVDFRQNKKKCEKEGLAEYVNAIEEYDIAPGLIVDAYLKRFYLLWMDAMLPKFPAVQEFRTRNQIDKIREFCHLDTEQFKIAQARVRAKIVEKIPDFDAVTTAYDEIGILKKEMNKRSRIMPLRKLFKEIPNLLTTLRPCFMMSPLSVSVYLEASCYEFDLVIFDEASQVYTEDAIGAIMRGKQTIIAGDTEQLPPTSVFSTINSINTNGSINSDDDDVVDDDDYESVLNEAVSVLPERSLKWHYRSRNENLIAFSNIKIYRNSLITFPSPINDSTDFGVEYIYVKDGVYSRSTKRNNEKEAEKVAELVFENFIKFPERSVGVVTFSEPQQEAVEAAIRKKRYENSSFETFFNEEREEPFFIKNLENVQGDERDTIIFSIGYAKDQNGIMYMNFGPLNNKGGYRRLNVAITRAKYNVKLVGSILPTDIDLEKTSSKGARLLKSYIDFAKNGIKAIENEIKIGDSVVFDSSFEEAVYDFLIGRGYDVVTQVGCSGFRIDMAIRNKVGEFVLGIECDGASYHSSRTARERDRLRQTVLEDMGWHIYRIWSTDWIKDQSNEEDKLILEIEKMLNEVPIEESCTEETSEENEFSVEVKNGPNVSNYGFKKYERISITSLCSCHSITDKIKKVITVEQPIHFDELCRRMAPALGREKLTPCVVKTVKRSLAEDLFLEVIVDDNDFISMVDFKLKDVRIPDPKSRYKRPMEYICDKEWALAMCRIAECSFGITLDGLFLETARVFGFRSFGEKIGLILNRVYKELLNTGSLKETDGKVNIIL